MYCITDQHIDYVLDDLRRKGIETEDLQFNLLDHICCMAEHTLEEEADFEAFYQQTIPRFYKKELRELEEETVLLLTFKHYYTMKKIMITGGAFSMLLFLVGSFFKVMHWPGAGILLTLGILSLSLLFLPMVFILKAKEVNTGLEKLTVAMGTLLGILFCFDILFSVNHWPGATVIWLTTICLSIFVFIPLYCFTGVRKPETRTNTILTTIVLVGFTGLQFTAISLKPSAKQQNSGLYSYAQSEAIWRNLEQTTTPSATAANIIGLSKQLKQKIMVESSDRPDLPKNLDGLRFHEMRLQYMGTYFEPQGEGTQLVRQIQAAVAQYNKDRSAGQVPLELNYSFLREPDADIRQYDNLYVLNSLTQLQIYMATLIPVPAFEPLAHR